MKENYHTHTFRCGHATGSEEEMILGAMEGGFTALGMSCHIPLPNFRKHLLRGIPYLSSFDNAKTLFRWFCFNGLGTRMPYPSKKEHLSIIKELKEKYKDQITIYQGFEAEYFEEYLDYYQSLLDNQEVDYLILGNHFHKICCDACYNGFALDKEGIENYGKDACLAMETGLYSYFCHPDLFMAETVEFDETCVQITRDICTCAIKNNIPLEINEGGFRRGIKKIGNQTRLPYPHDEFWKIVGEMGAPVVLGLDSHNPNEFSKKEVADLENYAKKMNLTVIPSFEFKKGKKKDC